VLFQKTNVSFLCAILGHILRQRSAASLFSGSPAGISFYQRGISRTFCPQLWRRRRRACNIKFILDGVGKAFYFQHRSGRKEEEKITIALSDGALALSGPPLLYVMFM
jgi:hypothetical protein